MNGHDITIRAFDGGTFTAYLSAAADGPAPGPAPGIVLIQEIFGVNAAMRAIADGLAGDGFTVLCPDIFWRQEPGVQISDKTQTEWDRAFELFQGFDVDLGVADLISTLDQLRTLDACTGTAGAIGYCLGGQLAYLMACRSAVDASVGYYGVHIQDALDEAGKITRPLMLHVAEKDQFVPQEAQTAVAAALADHDHVTLHSYMGMDHAFAREGGEHYDHEGATLANGRTIAFLKANLG